MTTTAPQVAPVVTPAPALNIPNPLTAIGSIGDKFLFLANAWVLVSIAVVFIVVGVALIFHKQTGQVLGMATGGKAGLVTEAVKAVKK